MRQKLWTLIGAIACVLAVSACGEDLDTGPVCPVLCPGQNIPVEEVDLAPVVLDTTFRGFPAIGTETRLLLADVPGAVLSYGIVRFDTLTQRYRTAPGTDDTTTAPITALDSAFLRLKFDTTGQRFTAPVTIELYDVAGVESDTSSADIVAAIVPENLVADTTLASAAALGDSLRIAIPKEYLQPRVTNLEPVRLAIRARSAEPVELRVLTVEGLNPAFLVYDPDPTREDIAPATVLLRSKTPADDGTLAARLRDYTILAQGTPEPPAGVLTVGGLPGRRAFLRFELPRRIIDSTSIVSAELLLTQTGDGVGSDTLAIVPFLGVAGAPIEDPLRQSLLTTDAIAAFGLDSLKVVPTDAKQVSLDIANVINLRWKPIPADTLPRYLVFRAAHEGSRPAQVSFHSHEAADESVRPRLRLRFIPSAGYGLP